MARMLRGGAKMWILFTSGENNILREHRLSKILIPQRENKIHIFKPPCKFLLLYRQNSLAIFSRTKAESDVIDILTSEGVQNMPLGSRMYFLMSFTPFYLQYISQQNNTIPRIENCGTLLLGSDGGRGAFSAKTASLSKLMLLSKALGNVDRNHRAQRSSIGRFPLCKWCKPTALQQLAEKFAVYWLTWWVPQNNNIAGVRKLMCFFNIMVINLSYVCSRAPAMWCYWFCCILHAFVRPSCKSIIEFT